MAEILEKALDLALDRKDPQKKLERRRSRESVSHRSPRPDEAETETGNRDMGQRRPKKSRYIPSDIRECVLERATYRCEYRAPGGARCTQRVGLEVDHVMAFSKGGPGEEGNLRALCRGHNLWSAERDFGVGFMQAKIAARSSRLQTR